MYTNFEHQQFFCYIILTIVLTWQQSVEKKDDQKHQFGDGAPIPTKIFVFKILQKFNLCVLLE